MAWKTLKMIDTVPSSALSRQKITNINTVQCFAHPVSIVLSEGTPRPSVMFPIIVLWIDHQQTLNKNHEFGITNH